MDVTPPEHVMCPKEHHECLQMSYKIPHYSTLMCIAIETICQLTKYDHICAIKRNRVYIYIRIYTVESLLEISVAIVVCCSPLNHLFQMCWS